MNARGDRRDDPTTQSLAYTVKEAAGVLGCGETLVRRLIAERALPHVRLGDRVVIPVAALGAWLASEAAASVKAGSIGVMA